MVIVGSCRFDTFRAHSLSSTPKRPRLFGLQYGEWTCVTTHEHSYVQPQMRLSPSSLYSNFHFQNGTFGFRTYLNPGRQFVVFDNILYNTASKSLRKKTDELDDLCNNAQFSEKLTFWEEVAHMSAHFVDLGMY